jgi:hypothetical protein
LHYSKKTTLIFATIWPRSIFTHPRLTATKYKEQNSSQQGRKGHKGLILNSATSYPKGSVFAAFAALLGKSSVLVSLAHLREDFSLVAALPALCSSVKVPLLLFSFVSARNPQIAVCHLPFAICSGGCRTVGASASVCASIFTIS